MSKPRLLANIANQSYGVLLTFWMMGQECLTVFESREAAIQWLIERDQKLEVTGDTLFDSAGNVLMGRSELINAVVDWWME